jgi:hypothetical protein
LSAWSTRVRWPFGATPRLSTEVRLGTAIAAGLLAVFAVLSLATVDDRMGLERRIVESFEAELGTARSIVSGSAITQCEKVETYHFACQAGIAVPGSAASQRGAYDLIFRDDGCWTAWLQQSEVQIRYPRQLSACIA